MSYYGPYKVGEFIRKGVYGKVFKVEGGRALKMLDPPLGSGLPEIAELNALKTFNHPCILRLDDFIIKSHKIGLVLPLEKSDLSILNQKLTSKVIFFCESEFSTSFLRM